MCEKLEQATCRRRGTGRRDKEEYKENCRAGKGERERRRRMTRRGRTRGRTRKKQDDRGGVRGGEQEDGKGADKEENGNNENTRNRQQDTQG